MRTLIENLMVVLALFAGVDGVTAGTVLLTWNPSTDTNVAGYKIYYGTASQVYTTNFAVANVTNIMVNGLADGTTYYFAATSCDAVGDESVFSNEASYAVPSAVTNQPPTLNPVARLTLNENAGVQTVNLSGITSGNAGQDQTLIITAVSSNPQIIPAPTVRYTSPNAAGTLTFAPALNAYGTATITVTVNNGGASNNVVSQSFLVTVNAVNQRPTLDPIANLIVNENTNKQTVLLTGVTSGAANENQTLKVTAISSNTRLVQPSVAYTSPKSNGTLTFKPANNNYGVATITVAVNDGGKSNNIMTRSFTVTVLSPAQALAAVTQAPSTNALADTAAILMPETPGASGQFSFIVAGIAGNQYVVEASEDLIHWTTVESNTAPFSLVDPNAGVVAQRYYRAYALP